MVDIRKSKRYFTIFCCDCHYDGVATKHTVKNATFREKFSYVDMGNHFTIIRQTSHRRFEAMYFVRNGYAAIIFAYLTN